MQGKENKCAANCLYSTTSREQERMSNKVKLFASERLIQKIQGLRFTKMYVDLVDKSCERNNTVDAASFNA